LDRLPRENEIVLFRYRNRLMAGVCLQVSRTKVRFAVSTKESVNVPLENVVLPTEQIAESKNKAIAWLKGIEKISEELQLDELWSLVSEEEGIWSVDELAGLYFSDDANVEQLATFVVALERGDYFESEGPGFRALDPKTIAEREANAQKEEEREAERLEFVDWFTKGLGDVKEGWIARIQDVAIHAENSSETRWLDRMMGEAVSPKRAFDLLVKLGIWERDVFLDLVREAVETEFSQSVYDAIKDIDLVGLLADSSREDLRHVDAVTIDNASTKDMDDAVSVQFFEDGTYQIGVHITDVSALVPVGSVLDVEASQRAASMYFPDQKIPMLPAELSEEMGSLRPEEDRLAISMLCNVGHDGQLGETQFLRSVIRCREKLSYDVADAILDEPTHLRYPMLNALFHVGEQLLLNRIDAGALSVANLNRRVEILPDGEISVSIQTRHSRADLLVSELMVFTNAEVGRFCASEKIPVFYRVQQAPDISEVEPTENERLHRYRVLKQMRPASSSLIPGAHGGLGVTPYCQSTSPLRRYLDLVTQRQLAGVLAGQTIPYTEEDLTAVGEGNTDSSRTIGRLERQRERYWLCRYLSALRGETFDALVLDVWSHNCKVEVVDFAWQVDVRMNKDVTPGDIVSVRLNRVDEWDLGISFGMV
jgi:exoribonuclease II